MGVGHGRLSTSSNAAWSFFFLRQHSGGKRHHRRGRISQGSLQMVVFESLCPLVITHIAMGHVGSSLSGLQGGGGGSEIMGRAPSICGSHQIPTVVAGDHLLAGRGCEGDKISSLLWPRFGLCEMSEAAKFRSLVVICRPSIHALDTQHCSTPSNWRLLQSVHQQGTSTGDEHRKGVPNN
jgi:hypothetical protein